GRALGSGTGPTGAMLPVAGPVAVGAAAMRSRCSGMIGSGVTASLDAVSAVAADCTLSVTAAASPDATAGAFGAGSAGSVGEAVGASPGGSARGPLRDPLFGSGSDAKPSPAAVLAASVSKGAGALCAAWGASEELRSGSNAGMVGVGRST